MTNNYMEDLQEEVLAVLTNSPMTINDLAVAVGKPYTTVQQVHKVLREEGKIARFDKRARNARWTIGNNNGPNTIVPELRFDAQSHKAVRFARHPDVFNQRHGSVGASVANTLAEIFDLAEKINNGFPLATAEISLTRAKARLHMLVNQIDDMRFFAQQILDNPKFWNPIDLEKFPNDVEWSIFSEYRAENPASDD